MKTEQLYPTKPMDCWGKMKELRGRYFKNMWQAQSKGQPLYVGAGLSIMGALPMGLGDTYSMMHGPYFARLMRDPDRAVWCHEASEAHGLSRDLCSTLRLAIGTFYRGFHSTPDSGEDVHPQFVFEPQICIAQSKIAQIFSREYSIPFIGMEIPFITDRNDPDHVESARRYFMEQSHQAIEKMVKATGIEFDDERLIEGVENQWEACRLWGQVCLLQQNTPAPLDMRMLESFGAMLFSVGPFRKDGVEGIRMLYEETLDRVDRGIAALGTERCRILYDGQPVYYRMSLLRYPSQYGAALVGGRFTYAMHGSYSIAEDGTWGPLPSLKELGITIRTRDDALRVLADHCMLNRPLMWTEYIPSKVQEHIMLARDWNVDGVLYHLDLGCKFIAAGHQEARLAVQNMGKSTMSFEASSSDPRDLAEGQVVDQMDTFLRNMGLTPTEDGNGHRAGDDE